LIVFAEKNTLKKILVKLLWLMGIVEYGNLLVAVILPDGSATI
jgi:hypothetical protein